MGWRDAPLVESKPQGGEKPKATASWRNAPVVGDQSPPTTGPESKTVGQHVAEGAAGLWQNVNPVTMVKGIYQAVRHPVDTFQAIAVDAPFEQGVKAGRALRSAAEAAAEPGGSVVNPQVIGPLYEAAGHAVAGAVPLIGPAAAHAGEQIAEGNIGRGIGEGIGLIVAPKVGRATVRATTGAVRAVAAPLSGKVNPAVAAAAERTGVEMPASALSESKAVPLIESLAAKGPLGSAAASRVARSFGELTARADQLAAHASKYIGNSEIGKVVAQGLNDYKAAWARHKNALYREAEIPTKMNLFVQAKGTVKFLDDVIAEKEAAARTVGGGNVPGLDKLLELRDGLTKVQKVNGRETRVLKDVQARDLVAARKQLSKQIKVGLQDPAATGDVAIMRRVSKTLEGELDAVIANADPVLAQKIDIAKTVYRDGLAKINSTYGKAIHKHAKAGEFDKVAEAVAKAQVSIDNVPRIMEVVGKDGAAAIRTSVLADIVGSAKRQAPSGDALLTPKGLAAAMAKYGDEKLAALLTPEEFSRLKDLRLLSASMEKGSKVLSGSQTAFLGRWAAYPTALLADPVSTLTVLVGDAAASRFIGSGAGQRLLTRGFSPISKAKADTAATVAGKAARPAASVSRMPQPQPRPAYPRAADAEDEDDSPRSRVATR